MVTNPANFLADIKVGGERKEIIFAVFKELKGYKLSDSGSSLSTGQSIGTDDCVVEPTSFIWFLVHIPVE